MGRITGCGYNLDFLQCNSHGNCQARQRRGGGHYRLLQPGPGKNTLGGAGIDWTTNITFVQDEFNSVWVRDYGPNTIYLNEVESLAFVDWIYNRPRPKDDVIPEAIAETLGLDIYCTTQLPTDLVHTGGNYMSDGMGTAFSSNLVLDENGE